MGVVKRAAATGVTIVALCVGALAVGAGEAKAAPPIVCVRNVGTVAVDVVAGVQAELSGQPMPPAGSRLR